MGKSAKRKSLSPSEKLNDLQDFLSRHGVPPIVFRVLPHITLKNRKDWSKPCHLKEMTENDIKNESLLCKTYVVRFASGCGISH